MCVRERNGGWERVNERESGVCVGGVGWVGGGG